MTNGTQSISRSLVSELSAAELDGQRRIGGHSRK